MKHICIILIFNTMMCFSQNDSLNLKNNEKKRFDSNDFKNLPLDKKRPQRNNDTFYRTDKEIIRIMTDRKDIVVRKMDIDSPYGSYEEYSPETKSLIKEGKMFGSMSIGVWKEYDENCKLIKETNLDSGFRFSLDSLIKKMKKEYNVDMLNQDKTLEEWNKVWVDRYIINNKSFYEVACSVYDPNTPGLCFLIDGNTGVALHQNVIYEEGQNIYDQYLKSLNKQK